MNFPKTRIQERAITHSGRWISLAALSLILPGCFNGELSWEALPLESPAETELSKVAYGIEFLTSTDSVVAGKKFTGMVRVVDA